MLGAVIGDVLGSYFEFLGVKTKDIDLFNEKGTFTDDTVLTVAIAKAILEGKSYTEKVVEFSTKYKYRGYGTRFAKWIESENHEPYNSWGNGSAMRVSAVGYAFDTVEEVLAEAKKSAEITHNHPEGIKGAQAVALCIFMARTGSTKEEIKAEIESRFQYDLSRKLDDIRKTYEFTESCAESVPESIISFLESLNFEDAIRNAISLGGDADTQACIAASIAEAFYQHIDENMKEFVFKRLNNDLRADIAEFCEKFNITTGKVANTELLKSDNILDTPLRLKNGLKIAESILKYEMTMTHGVNTFSIDPVTDEKLKQAFATKIKEMKLSSTKDFSLLKVRIENPKAPIDEIIEELEIYISDDREST